MVDCLYKGPLRLDCIYVDSMLGWLARLLRIVFGLRVAYAPDLDDAELLRTECLVVTRDEEVFRARRGPALLLRTDDHVKWIAAFLSMADVFGGRVVLSGRDITGKPPHEVMVVQ